MDIFYHLPKIYTYPNFCTYVIISLCNFTNKVRGDSLKINNFSIKKQFKLVIICIGVLITILSSLSLFFVNRILIKKSSAYMEDVSQNAQLEFSNALDRATTIIDTLVFDSDLEKLLKNPYSSDTPELIKNLNRKFRFFSSTTPELADISVYSPEMTWSNFFDKETSAALQKKLTDQPGLQSLGLIQSTLKTRTAPRNTFLLLGQNIYGTTEPDTYGKQLGTLFICLDPALFISAPSNTTGETNHMLLVDSSDKYCTLTGNPQEGKSIFKMYKNRQNLSLYRDVFVSEEYILDIKPVYCETYQLVLAFDRTDIEKTVTHTFLLLFIIILLSCGIILLLLYMMLNNMIFPLEKIAAYMKKISSSAENSSLDSFTVSGCAEIRTLNETFQKMLSERQRLTQQLYQATVNLYETRLQKKDAELKYLRSQVNPHFLYNTLASIKSLAFEHQVPEIADMTEALSQLFRYNVKGKQMVPLEQEISIISAYFQIQNIRFGKSLEIIYSILDDTKHLMVMKFLLQPLIENAIVHGFSKHGNKGTLFVASHCTHEKLLITVQDDGIGMTEEQLTKIHFLLEKGSGEQNTEENHLGLTNVHYRIQLAYGTAYGLHIESAWEEGTRITLSLPIIKPEKSS